MAACEANFRNYRVRGELIRENPHTVVMRTPSYFVQPTLVIAKGKVVKRHKTKHQVMIG